MLTRDEALALLEENNITPSLMKHALASEAVLTSLARYFGEDEQLWALTGLLHDLDFPQTESSPETHGLVTVEKLSDKLPPEYLRAITAHNGEMNGTSPESRLDYALRCGESITGLISAAALMRPTGYEGMEPKSIKKKMKDKAFAASVNRENIKECEKAGISLDEFIALAIKAMASLDDQNAKIR